LVALGYPPEDGLKRSPERNAPAAQLALAA